CVDFVPPRGGKPAELLAAREPAATATAATPAALSHCHGVTPLPRAQALSAALLSSSSEASGESSRERSRRRPPPSPSSSAAFAIGEGSVTAESMLTTR